MKTDFTTLPREASPPMYDVPILDWWEGIYDHAFIAFQPFYWIDAGGKGDTADREPVDERIEENDVKARGVPISWEAMHAAIAPHRDMRSFYLAGWLLAAVGGAAGRTDVDPQLLQKIQEYCREQRIYLPEDGQMATVIEPIVFRFLRRFGVERITVYGNCLVDHFDVPLADFAPETPAFFMPETQRYDRPLAIHLPEPGVYMAWEFDSCEAIIAMTERARKIARPEEFFEGFYADEQTYSSWPNQSPIERGAST